MQHTSTSAPTAAEQPASFERVLDARLIMSVVAAGIMSFSGVVVETAMNVTFPTLMAEFGVGTSTVQWMTTSYLLVLAAIVPTSSWMSRRFRTKSIFVAAMIFYISGITCGMLAVSFPMLLAGRILEGVGTGIALPLMFNIITEQAPTENMGVMMGVGSLVTAMAPAVGPSVGGWLAENYGWRMIFAGLLPMLVVAFVLGIFSIRQSHETSRPAFDLLGWLLLVASFASLVFATSEAGTYGWASPQVAGMLLACVVLMVLFVRRERTAASPLISLEVFSQPGFVLCLVALVAFQFTTLGLSFLLPNYSQLVNGTGETVAGSILLPGCLLGAVLSPVSGRILDRAGARRPILAGCTFALVAVSLYCLLSTQLETRMATAIYMLYTLGQGLFYGNTLTTALRYLSAERKADGNAVANTLQQLAGALGTSVVTTVVNAAQAGAGDMALATVAGTHSALVLLAGVALVPLVGMVCALVRVGEPDESPHRATIEAQAM